jgi:hypothetical protein
MKVRMLSNADGYIKGVRTALFIGQTYDVDDAGRLIEKDLAVDCTPVKAVHGPPEDKAYRAPVRRQDG